MELNRIVFPSPASSYTYETYKDKLIFVPKVERQEGALLNTATTNRSTDITMVSTSYLSKNDLIRKTFD